MSKIKKKELGIGLFLIVTFIRWRARVRRSKKAKAGPAAEEPMSDSD